MNPQKKGFLPRNETIDRLRNMATDFVEFCMDYRAFFQVYRSDVSHTARNYLAGLLMKAPRKNMERIDEYVEGSNYQACQQFISDSPWDAQAVNRQIAKDANAILGGIDSVLCIDESGFSKKGKESVGVKREWNGRLGKVDNCQVGVFASLCNENKSSIINNRLFLPEDWVNDEARCLKAKVPKEYIVNKTKLEIAQEMVDTAINNDVKFGWVAADAFYGRDFKLLCHLDKYNNKFKFVMDIPKIHTVYLEDPKPYLPRRKNKIGPKHKRLKSRQEPISVSKLFDDVSPEDWRTITVRDTTKGKLFIKATRKHVYIWDGETKAVKKWWLVLTYDKQSKERKYFLSNASASENLSTIIRRHSVRYWIERAFQDGKTSVGMGDYQARGWNAWHHHMTMVSLAMLFMLKERISNKDEIERLSCQDIVELLNIYLPRKDTNEVAVVENMLKRHDQRKRSIESAYRVQKRKLKLTK